MERGTISKIFDYYFGKDQFKEETFKAIKEFFNKPNLKAGDKLEMEEDDETLFNEWFIFDFKLSKGKTPLEDFYERNPYQLNMARLQVYKDLQDNHFGLYKVKEVRLGEGLTLENLQTGKVYQVREFSATFGLKKGQVFSGRVGKVADHYELVGGDPSFKPIRLDTNLEKIFRKDKTKLNPKILKYTFLNSKPDESDQLSIRDYSSLEGVEADFKKVLAKYDLDKFVSVEAIKERIYNYSKDDLYDFSEVNMLCSLLYSNMKGYNNALAEIFNSFTNFYNFCPQKELGNKSPFEKGEEGQEKGIPLDIKMSLRKFSYWDWGKKYNKALQYMEQVKFEKALKKFNEVFAYLLKHKITYPEIYRLYANKGVCHLILGELKLGEFMLKTAVNLNSFYDLAKQQLKKFEKIKHNFQKTRKTEKENQIVEDIGYRYYQFLKRFEINFNQPLKKSTSNC